MPNLTNKFFVCITALCDCLIPKKNKFYFAEGEKIKLKEALELGDGAFISYLTTGEILMSISIFGWPDLLIRTKI